MIADSHRLFSVHPRHVARQHARMIVEASFEAAAVAYVEDFCPAAGEAEAVTLLVRDVEDGVEHCFRIALASGGTAPCP